MRLLMFLTLAMTITACGSDQTIIVQPAATTSQDETPLAFAVPTAAEGSEEVATEEPDESDAESEDPTPSTDPCHLPPDNYSPPVANTGGSACTTYEQQYGVPYFLLYEGVTYKQFICIRHDLAAAKLAGTKYETCGPDYSKRFPAYTGAECTFTLSVFNHHFQVCL
jgi:hypothetical protein